MRKVILTKTVSRYLAKLDKKTAARIIAAIKGLQGSPMQGDLEVIKGERDKMRLRVGSYRVLFRVGNDIIEVVDIGPRGDIYK
jgi:mRNA interferase RelE/StbE